MQNKVTFLVSAISNGGAEAVCVNVANGLAQRGWQVDLLVLHTKDKSYIGRLNSKVNLIDLKAGRARYAAPALLWYILKNKPKQLVVFKYELIDLVVILKKLFRLQVKLIGRNISILSESRKASSGASGRLLVKRWLGTPIEQVDCLINQSYEMQKDLLQHHPVLKDRSVVIHNPVAAHIEAYAKANPSKNVNDEYILCVGRLAPVKAFHQAIAAFALIANQYPKFRLKFVGQGELQQALEQQARELGIADRVDFEGFQTDVIPYQYQATSRLFTYLGQGNHITYGEGSEVLADMYANFGFLGIVMLMLIFGFLSAKVNQKSKLGSFNYTLVYVVILITALSMNRGTVFYAYKELFYILLFHYLFARKRIRPWKR